MMQVSIVAEDDRPPPPKRDDDDDDDAKTRAIARRIILRIYEKKGSRGQPHEAPRKEFVRLSFKEEDPTKKREEDRKNPPLYLVCLMSMV